MLFFNKVSILFCSVSFDYENKSSYSSLQVVATDNGVVPRSSVPSTITVNIVNVNDNTPVFGSDTFSE